MGSVQATSSACNGTVLVVDDDAVVREVLRRMLRVGAYRIIEATTGREALAVVAQQPCDCILLDYRLADTDGLSLMGELQTALARPCPVIFVTGIADERLIVEAMRRGAFDYVNKDRLDGDVLRQMVASGMRWADLETRLLKSQQQLQHLSLYDALTGLPNRNLFFSQLEQRGQERCPFALLMLDLNMFKDINDTLGHATGDVVLTEVGQRLKQHARGADVFARLGGDEFAAILQGVETVEAALPIVRRLLSAVGAPFRVEGRELSVGASIGVALFPEHGTNTHELLAKADQAMYRAKRGSRGYELCDASAPGHPRRDLLIHSELAQALAARQISVQYQPQVDLSTGECCGVEALARWRSPTLGEVGPCEFIPIAERSPIITSISYYILDVCLRQARAWLDLGLSLPVAVNLSARLLDDQGLVDTVLRCLHTYEVPPSMLTLEITETALTAVPSKATSVIQALSAAGIRVSMDDFGTGYTSFWHLREFALSEIKVDKSFVGGVGVDARDSSIIEACVSLSHGFNVTLVAEGVEDAQGLAALRKLGCRRAQGFGIARPMAAEQLPDWLAGWNAAGPHRGLALVG